MNLRTKNRTKKTQQKGLTKDQRQQNEFQNEANAFNRIVFVVFAAVTARYEPDEKTRSKFDQQFDYKKRTND